MFKKATATICAAVLAGSVFPVAAFAQEDGNESNYGEAEKTEVVYVKTDKSGNQSGVYVVNQFQSDVDTVVKDAGSYKSVKNISDNQLLDAVGTSTFNVGAGQTYLYQGNLDEETSLPWSLSVRYILNGKQVEGNELAGKSGELEIDFSVKPNSSFEGNYADNYLLQVSSSFDNNLVHDIDVQGATIAQNSGSTQVSYMIFPGKSADYTVHASVSNFEFDGWQVVGIPLSLALDFEDGDFSDSAKKFDELEAGIRELNDGSNELLDGVNSLADATKAFKEGNASLSDAFGVLAESGSTLEQGEARFSQGVSQNIEQLNTAAGQIDSNSAQKAYSAAMQSYTAAFSGAFTRAYMPAYQGYIAAGLSENEANQRASEQATYSATQATAAEYGLLEQSLTELVSAQATKAGYSSAANALTEVQSNYSELASGLTSYVQGVKQLSTAADGLENGSSQLYDGTQALAEGNRELAKGTQELQSETTGMSKKLIDEVRNQLSDYLNPNFELHDFVNNSVEGVKAVQFVYMTEAIEIPEGDNSEPDSIDNRNFFEKFLSLFGL